MTVLPSLLANAAGEYVSGISNEYVRETISTTAETPCFIKHFPSLNEFWWCRFLNKTNQKPQNKNKQKKPPKKTKRHYMLETSDQGCSWIELTCQARRDFTRPDKSANTFGVSSPLLLSDGKAVCEDARSQEAGYASRTAELGKLPWLHSQSCPTLLATKMPLFRCAIFRASWEHSSHNSFPPVNDISWKRRQCAETCWFRWNIWRENWRNRDCFDFLISLWCWNVLFE